MHVFEFVIALLLGGAAFTALSRRIGTPYPALLALAGAGLALVPGTPTLALDPELALTLFVAPVLLDAAFDASARDLRANWRTVAGLAVGAVALTVVVVAVVVRLLVPGPSWAVAIALGAMIAPPDAAAATAVLQQLRPPHRLLVILEGESLFNDASALLIYRLAVGAAVGGTLSPGVVPMLLVATVGSVALGLALSAVIGTLLARVHDVAIAVVVQFCGTFAVWMLAERLHLSGILTVVVFAMASARRASRVTPARIRIPSYAIWEFAVFVLNVLAFILVGLQWKAILGRLDSPTLLAYAGVAGAVCLATILARLAWVWGAAAFGRWWCRRAPGGHAGPATEISLTNRAAAAVGWSGMRGIVTLATALALPDGFPYRDLLLFVAFSVVLGTLVVQGMTLRPLMNALRLEDDGSVEREVRLARVEALRAAVAALREVPGDEMSGVLHRRYEVLLRRARADVEGAADVRARRDGRGFDNGAEFVRQSTAAARRRLLALRAEGVVGDEAFQRVEQELDLEELNFQPLGSGAEAPRDGAEPRSGQGSRDP